MWGIYVVAVLGLAGLFWVIDKERLPAMTYSDMLVRIDWNDRISAEENARRTENLVASLGIASFNPRSWRASSSSSFRIPRRTG